MHRSTLCLTLALAVACGAQAAPKKKPAAKKPAPPKKAAPKPSPKATPTKAAPSFNLSTGVTKVLQPLATENGNLVPGGPLSTREIPASVKWLRNAHYLDGNAPLFPAGPLGAANAQWSPEQKGVLPRVPAFGPTGQMTLAPARWMTLSGSGKTLTVPVGAQESYPSVQITSQTPGNVVRIGQSLPLAVTFTNPGGEMKKWVWQYKAMTASGTQFDTGQFTTFVPAMHRVTTPVSIGAITIPGAVTVEVTVKDGATVIGTAKTGGGAVTPHQAVKTGEFPFGLTGGDVRLAEAAGVQFHVGGWPWWHAEDSVVPVGAKHDDAPGSAEGVFSLADKLGIALVSRDYAGSADHQNLFASSAMKHFKRRAGGWTLPYSAELSPLDYTGIAQTFYATSKSIHKDANTFVELPAAATGGLEVGRAISSMGAEPVTDVLAVRGLGVMSSSEEFRPTLQSLIEMRNAAYPGREIWNTGETLQPKPDSSPVQQAGQVVRSSVAQLAAGVDKVFWIAEPGLLNEDGSAAPGFFGLSSLTEALGGAEYVGPMPWQEPLRGEVFIKDGSAVLVAWSESNTPQGVTLPLQPRVNPDAYDPMFTRANLAALSGNKLTVRSVPVFVTGLGKSLIPEAYAAGRALRLEEMRKAFDAIGIKIGEDFPATMSDEKGVELLNQAMEAYRPDNERRTETLNAIYRLMRLWDLEAVQRAAASPPVILLSANAALDKANRSQADFRSEIDLRESAKDYQQDIRILLGLAEKRLYLARQALRQKDYALAKSHAEQMAVVGRAIIPFVKVWPLNRDTQAIAHK